MDIPGSYRVWYFLFQGRISANIGVPASKGALLVGLLTMSQTVGKVVAGNFMDRPGVNRLILAQLSMLVTAVATCLLPLATSYSALLVYVIVAGLMDGLFVIVLGLVTRDILGQNLLSKGIGQVYGFMAIPLTIGAPIAGLIYDGVGSYNPVFFLSSSLMTLGVCLMFLIPWSHLLSRRKFEAITSSFGNSLNTTSLYSTKNPKYKNIENPFVTKGIPTHFVDNERNHLLELECGHTAVSRPSSVILFGIVTALTSDDFQTNEESLTGQLSNGVTHHANDATTQSCLANTARVKVDFLPPNSWKTSLFSLANEPSDLPTVPKNILKTKPFTLVSSLVYYDNQSPRPTAPTTNNLNIGISNESKESDRVSWNSETSEISLNTMSQVSADSGYVEEAFPCFSASKSCSYDKDYVNDDVYASFRAATNTLTKSDYDNSPSYTRDSFYSNVPPAWSNSKSEIHNLVTCGMKEDVFKSITEPIHDSNLLGRADSFDYCSQLAEDILERNVTSENLKEDNFCSCEVVGQTSMIKQDENVLLKEKEMLMNITENGENLLLSEEPSLSSKPFELSCYRVNEELEGCNKLCAKVEDFPPGANMPTLLAIHCYRKCVIETAV